MPYYTIEALEKFVVRTTYFDVEADSPGEAEIQDGDEEYLETISVEEQNDADAAD